MLGPNTQAYSELRNATKEILDGIMLSIDPSIGSTSSMPAWAAYQAGILLRSGVILIDCTMSTPLRLQALNYAIRQLIKNWDPDVLVYENITDIPFKGYAARGHASLHKALGAILSISGPEKYVGILPGSWKKMVRPEYVKSDENDAIELGWVAIQEARRIAAIIPKKKRRKQ